MSLKKTFSVKLDANGNKVTEHKWSGKPPTAGVDPKTFCVPSIVSRFDRSTFQFAAETKPVETRDATSGRPAPVPFTMLARTGAAIDHWWWGAIIHDMSGFKARKDVVCIDYCHNAEEIIGYADKQDATNDGLLLTGALTPFTADDRASEVVYKASQKVPYEASIDFDYLSVEWVPEKASTQVNGSTFTGPGYVVREWTIASSAVCPYGADPNTSTTFAQENETRSVTLFSKSGAPLMTTNVTETGTVPDATKTTPTELTADQVKANLTAGLKKFTTKFGAENGANWFTDGKSYEEALELHIDAQAETIKKLTADLEAANTKLANAPKGETTPVSTSDAEKPAKSLSKKPVEDSNIAKFAAVNKLPGAK